MKPNWRQPFGIAMILLLIAAWAGVVASQSERIGQLPAALQLIVYIIAGVVWIAPLKPWLQWMETGSFRVPKPLERDRRP